MAILTEILLLCDGGQECQEQQPYNQDGQKDAKIVSSRSAPTHVEKAGCVLVAKTIACGALFASI